MALETSQGIKRILLFRLLGDESNASKIALQTEHSVSRTKDISTEATKDITTWSAGQLEEEISSSFILSVGDEALDELKEAQEDGTKVALWDVDMNPDNKKDEKYKATYYETVINSISEAMPVEGGVTVDVDYTVVDGIGQRGYTAVTAEQEEVIQYAFKEAVADSGNE